MLGRNEAYELRRRLDAVMSEVGLLCLQAAHPSFREQAALIEIDALDTRYKLSDKRTQENPNARVGLELELGRLERRCAHLTSWLAANGLEAELPGTFA